MNESHRHCTRYGKIKLTRRFEERVDVPTPIKFTICREKLATPSSISYHIEIWQTSNAQVSIG